MSTRNQAIVRTANKLYDIGSGGDRNENVQLSDTEIGEEVDAAVIQYSLDRPRERVISVAGTGGAYYNVTNLTGWVNDWSRIVRIEYPVTTLSGTQTSKQTYVDLERVSIVRDASNYYLHLDGYSPSAAEAMLVEYTTPHTLDASTDTIPTPHFDAVCDLAAAFCCNRLASKFAKAIDQTIAADSANYRDGQARFRSMENQFMDQYRRKVGLPRSGPVGASAFGNWTSRPSIPWMDRVTHPRRYQ
jgi:hypothetical protein